MKNLIAALVFVFACSSTSEVYESVSESVVTQKQYCANRCGNFAFGTPPNQCYCDDACFYLGDCCSDYFVYCGCSLQCVNQAPSGCYCDTSCTNQGDCCPLKHEFCGLSSRSVLTDG